MGAEFLSRTRKTIVKHIDAKRVALATADLLTITPKDQPRCLIASVAPGANVNSGETVILEARSGKLSARRGNAVVANFDNPGSDFVAAIGKAGGVTTGVVQRVHKLSKKMEISL